MKSTMNAMVIAVRTVKLLKAEHVSLGVKLAVDAPVNLHVAMIRSA